MTKYAAAGLVALLLATAGTLRAQAPEMPKPAKEHELLQQFVGEWEVKMEAVMGPDAKPIKCEGTEKARSLGEFWIVAEGVSTPMGQKMESVMQLGYDPATKKFIGTWIDSASGHMWKYEGSVDATGKIFTLEAEGPNMLAPGKTAKYRDVTEFKSQDERTLASSMLGEDGKWMQFMAATYKRVK